MPTRVIRDGILTSKRINALSDRAELFYRRLMSVVDDYGRYFAEPMLLRAACYPLKLDSVKEDSIKKHLAEAEDAGLIVLYTVAGTAYLEIQDFGQRVQSKPKFPGIVSDLHDSTVSHGESPGKTAIDGVEDGDEINTPSAGADSGSPKKQAKPKAQSIPYDDVVTAYHEALPMLPQVRKLTEPRRRKLKARWLEDKDRQRIEYWQQFFAYVAKSDFLTGRNNAWTGCDFEWLIESSNHIKIIEGKYENREYQP